MLWIERGTTLWIASEVLWISRSYPAGQFVAAMPKAGTGMDRKASRAYTGAMDIGTRIFTWLHGRRVGGDADGNIYYEDKRGARAALGGTGRPRRWVMYGPGMAEPTRVPPEWHAWLHHTTDAPIVERSRKAWEKPHLPNATGTASSYRPPGHDYSGGRRAPASGDYEAWTPGS